MSIWVAPKNKRVTQDTDSEKWRPSAAIFVLRQRAALLAEVRKFFSTRHVLEVETPALSHAASSEVHLQTMQVAAQGMPPAYLHTSPELAMKRLLAAGSGDIFQICKVFRAGEQGSWHNPEFTLLEWYRLGYDMTALMQEVADLLTLLLPNVVKQAPVYLTYRQVFKDYAHIDPFVADAAALQRLYQQQAQQTVAGLSQQDWLDLILSVIVQPRLPTDCLVFITHFPATQASLAQLDPTDPTVAHRFEVFLNGLELANGFVELSDPREQRARIDAEQQRRQQAGLACLPIDENFLAALHHGLPACSGVAMGIDRVVMLVAQQDRIEHVISFEFDRA